MIRELRTSAAQHHARGIDWYVQIREQEKRVWPSLNTRTNAPSTMHHLFGY